MTYMNNSKALKQFSAQNLREKERNYTHVHACMHACMHARTHAHMFYSSLDFVREYPGEPVPKETFTHSHVSWSSIILYLLPPSTAIHGILPVLFTRLTKKEAASLRILVFYFSMHLLTKLPICLHFNVGFPSKSWLAGPQSVFPPIVLRKTFWDKGHKFVMTRCPSRLLPPN